MELLLDRCWAYREAENIISFLGKFKFAPLEGQLFEGKGVSHLLIYF